MNIIINQIKPNQFNPSGHMNMKTYRRDVCMYDKILLLSKVSDKFMFSSAYPRTLPWK